MRREQQSKLKRNVSLPLLILYGLGNIFGAGIYVLIGELAGIAGEYIPLSFLLACIVISFTALSYAELSARYPLSAGEAIYVNAGFNSPLLATAVGLSVAFAGLLSSATILHGFHGYLSTFVEIPQSVTALIITLLISTIAIWGIRQSALVTALLTLIEILGLSMVLYAGLDYLSWEFQPLKSSIPPPDISIINSIVLGAFLAFFAFLGFEDMVNIAEEVKDPAKSMPRAIIITLTVVTFFYIVIALVSISVLPPDELAHSNAPLAKVYETATGTAATTLSIIAMTAVINGMLIQIIMASRIFYGMSFQGWLPAFLMQVHPKTATPINATITAGTLVFLLATAFPILTLAQSTSFLVFIIFTLVNASLVRIKLKEPHPKGVRIYPIIIPVTAIFLNLTLLVFQIRSLF